VLSRNVKVKMYKTIIISFALYGCETWFLTLREKFKPKTIILPVVLYGCGTLSLTLMDERRLRVFENRVLRRTFEPKKEDVTGEWRKLRNEELHNLFSSPNIIRQIKSRRMRWAGHVACMGEESKVYKVLVRNPEGKRPLGRPRSRWENWIRMDRRDIGWEVWSGFKWLRIENGGGQL
jgi:hypothetical protein